MSSIQELIGKIEKNQKKNQKISENSQKKEIKKRSPEEISAAREKFSGHKKNDTPKKTEFGIKKGKNKTSKTNLKSKNTTDKKSPNTKKSKKPKSPVKKRFFVTQVCTSKKSCGEKFGPYVWERLCNDYNQDPNCKSFEIQGFLFEQSPCQGACKKSANIRIKEENASAHTQFSYLTPIKASKLIKMIKSGASPENIKRL